MLQKLAGMALLLGALTFMVSSVSWAAKTHQEDAVEHTHGRVVAECSQ